LLYAAVSRPQQQLVLSWHAADDDGTPATRSLFVDDVCDLFCESLLAGRVRAGAATGIASDGREPTPASALAGQGALAGQARAGPIAPLRDAQLLADLREHTWSASSLEVWISCPVRWLVERMLRAGDLDPQPEPLTRGGLAHAVLRQTLEGLRRETGSARLTPQRLGLARELLARALAEHAGDYPLSAATERRPALRRRLHADLERYLQHAADNAGEQALEPAHLELAFGFAVDQDGASAAALPAFALGDGVMMRGRIDRVDVDEQGEAIVYDYKGGNVSPAARWIGEGDLQVALYMLVVEELLGVQAVGGFYQPLSGSDLRARGVLDRDGHVAVGCVGGDERDHAEVRALLAEAAQAALGAAAQAGRGELRPRPRTCAYKGGCMYPAICRCES
jgi:RecB family exonuclease